MSAAGTEFLEGLVVGERVLRPVVRSLSGLFRRLFLFGSFTAFIDVLIFTPSVSVALLRLFALAFVSLGAGLFGGVRVNENLTTSCAFSGVGLRHHVLERGGAVVIAHKVVSDRHQVDGVEDRLVADLEDG